MMVQAKIRSVQIGIGLIFRSVSTVAFVFKFARSKVQFYQKNDQIYKIHPLSFSSIVTAIELSYPNILFGINLHQEKRVGVIHELPLPLKLILKPKA